ncbi:uncharacterized protein LOC119681117 [Teleopsis dalmanni]|uniref:uncharacterized protein LOC119681117 n=1 Tax=Teleopsis dalmanni TaxID=139649 RepID=UPI0018CCF52A|nr:uncharacterized protein LOC119681117 [Teleopsis dalmanni]
MFKHSYSNAAFCQNSEFYSTNSSKPNNAEEVCNSSLNLNENVPTNVSCNSRDGPLRIQRSMSTRSFVSKPTLARKPSVIRNLPRKQILNQQQNVKNHYKLGNYCSENNITEGNHTQYSSSCSGRYALVPVEELVNTKNKQYTIIPGITPYVASKRYAKSQENLDRITLCERLQNSDEPNFLHGDSTDQFCSLPAVSSSRIIINQTPKIKHAFSSDFNSTSFLLVDKNSNQKYEMVPTAEDEEIVDDNQEIIQMHNGRAHRYAVIPTEDDNENLETEEEETCLSSAELNRSQIYLGLNYETEQMMSLRTSTPQKDVSISKNASYPSTPLKNPAATKMLHELLSTPRKTPTQQSAHQQSAHRINSGINHLQRLEHRTQYHIQQQIDYAPPGERKKELLPQRLHYETVKTPTTIVQPDRTMAVITPRVAESKVYAQVDDCSSIHAKSLNNSYPQKVANATITLAIVSLMLVVGSTMNSGLIIYMIAHFGKSFYLQFSLMAAFCGVGLGFLGFRSRHCEWLPNRSYTSGYILVTMFCLLKCCGLLVILVLDPYPGLPLHDVTTGVILGLSTFTIFFIGLGVIGSLWCYRPPPDNRVNII